MEQASNPLLTSVKSVQPTQSNLVDTNQVKPVYIFLEMSIAYDQHGSLKQVTIFFEQTTLIAQTWLQKIDNLVNLKSKYNTTNNLLIDTNNQLQAHCLKLVNHKQALQNINKELTVVKAQLLKQQA